MNDKINTQEALKLYLDDILSLRPAKNMSVLSFFIFKLGKELLNNIGENAGHIGDLKRYLPPFYELGKGKLPIEEGKVVKLILEGIEWTKSDSERWKLGIPTGLHGDEIFHAFDFVMMTDKEIEEDADPDPLSRLKSIGVEVKEEIEDLKWHAPTEERMKESTEQHNVVSPDFDVWQDLEKLAKAARSDFFDYVSDETLNDISDCCDFLDEGFIVYLKREKKLKEQVRAICSDTFDEKWKLLLKVFLQVEEENNLRRISNEAIIELLPFVSDIDWELDTIMMKIPVLEPKVLYLFGNLLADDFGYKNGWYYGWYD